MLKWWSRGARVARQLVARLNAPVRFHFIFAAVVGLTWPAAATAQQPAEELEARGEEEVGTLERLPVVPIEVARSYELAGRADFHYFLGTVLSLLGALGIGVGVGLLAACEDEMMCLVILLPGVPGSALTTAGAILFGLGARDQGRAARLRRPPEGDSVALLRLAW